MNIPATRDNDADDVQCALTVARACRGRGDHDDALKWLRRAAHAAAEGEDLARAVELSKAAAAVDASAMQSPRQRVPSDLEDTGRRPASNPFELVALVDDDQLDVPTEVRAAEPAPSHPLALERRSDLPPEQPAPPSPRSVSSEIPSLSATRIAVIPGARGGRPEMVFLAADAAVPTGAAVAMIVPQSAEDALRLAAMLPVLQDAG